VLSNVPAAVSEDWHIETKPFAPRIANGMRLRFSLRANPVVTHKSDDGRHVRRDVVMVRKHGLKRDGTPRGKWPSQQQLVQEECVKWLLARAEKHGFVLIKRPEGQGAYTWLVETNGYRQHEMHKRGAKPILFSTVDFDGVLEVTDADVFSAALQHGIGPAKGFGCGLLLIRRAAEMV